MNPTSLLPRRTLLSRIAAALVALSAPVVALGAGRRRESHEQQMDRAYGKAYDLLAQNIELREERAMREWTGKIVDAAETELREARGLLAEARGRIMDLTLMPNEQSGLLPKEHLLSRIDSHLRRGEEAT